MSNGCSKVLKPIKRRKSVVLGKLFELTSSSEKIDGLASSAGVQDA
jgi:hypothetical protein